MGGSRERVVCRARRQFLLRGLDEAGMSMAEPAWLCGRNPASISHAIELARAEAALGEKGGGSKYKAKTATTSCLRSHLLETVISKRATLQFHLAEQLPAVEADASQLRQVVMNLITNASEALGGNNGTIRLCTGVVNADRNYLGGSYLGEELSEGQYVYVEVSDTGTGMDEDTRQKIFDPFFTTKFTGRGLGLAAVLGIVRGHHGVIRVYTEPNKGSTFKVLFPASSAPVEKAPHQPGVSRNDLGEATLLVVDDDPQVLDVAKAMLEQAGFHVLTAADGREGVELFQQHGAEIALVVLDMTMPRMDGEEAFCEMRRIRPDVRVILSSGYNEQEATNRFAGKGLAGFIQKPYRSAQLLERVYQTLERG